jgi:hypothetical protein
MTGSARVYFEAAEAAGAAAAAAPKYFAKIWS